ncbi:MAG: 16S rRNA (cytidine(1402)-2'-O)-methyltransferase, partial [Myxococcota bacterium]
MNRREAGGVRDGKGRLFIVATPIGNLEDITLRALRVLGQVDAILAEDTRRTRTLSQYHQIETPLRAFHAHSSPHSAQGILEELKAGAQLALVSDAGTPLISDPGAHLVSSARESGIIVEAIPGVSAVTAAVSVAGVRVDRFRFLGFLPRKGGERAQFLETIRLDSAASVFFESPRRVRPTLLELAEI